MTTALGLNANQSTDTNSLADNILASKATTVYVDTQLALKAKQSTTYAKTEVDTTLGL